MSKTEKQIPAETDEHQPQVEETEVEFTAEELEDRIAPASVVPNEELSAL